MTPRVRRAAVAAAMLGLLVPATAGRAAVASAPARKCPAKPAPAHPGDASTKVDLDQDGRADLLVLNFEKAPNVRVALADGRQMFTTYAAPDEFRQSYEIEAVAAFPGVFALSSSSPLSRFSSSQQQDYFVIHGCSLSRLQIDGKDLQTVVESSSQTSSGTQSSWNFGDLRCFAAPDAHVELVTSSWQAATPSYDVVRTRQRVVLSRAALRRQGAEERLVDTIAFAGFFVGTPSTSSPPPPFPDLKPAGNPCRTSIGEIRRAEYRTPPKTTIPVPDTTIPAVARPVGLTTVRLSEPVVDIDSGDDHTCAVHDSGKVSCWGLNALGQLGIEGGGFSSAPATVVGLSGPAARVSASVSHTCALLRNATVTCWGDIGPGERPSKPRPMPELGSPVIAIASGSANTCVILKGGAVRCLGAPENVTLDRAAVALSVGFTHACALLDDGSMRCWGSNRSAELGTGAVSDEESAPPVPVRGLGGRATAVAAGGAVSCALVTSALRCWGVVSPRGYVEDEPPVLSPAPVPAMTGAFRSVHASGGHVCALSAAGSVRCFGYYDPYRSSESAPVFADVDLLAPQTVRGLTGATAIAVGDGHGCALLRTKTVKCWGFNNLDQLGSPTP